MKNRINIISAGLTLLLIASCSKWLDVEPKSQIKSEVSFQTQGGFKDALIGAYMLMTSSQMYGKEMTFGFAEAVGQQFSVIDQANPYYGATRYLYSTTTATTDAFWAEAYTTIVNLNNLLENLELKRNLFTTATYSVIKGEALGLRAFLHFDLLRLYGWGDLKNRPEKLDAPILPYVEKYDKTPVRQHTVREVLDFVKRDLLISKQLLDEYGPLGTGVHGDDYLLPNDDKFFDTRYKRFNYWASVCTLARVYLWEGNEGAALEMSELYIAKGASKNPWVLPTAIDNMDETKIDLVFSTEQIFCLEVSGEDNLFRRIRIYMDATLKDKNSMLVYHTSNQAKAIFEANTCGKTDYRYAKHYNKVNNFFDGWAIVKYWEVPGYSFGSRMTLIRKTEMYYIAAEALLATGSEADKKKAIGYLNTVRNNRGIAPSFSLPEDLIASRVKEEITKEWRKEFLSEGQMFYYYKRLGFPKIGDSNYVGNDETYVIPLPRGDVNLGGLTDNIVVK